MSIPDTNSIQMSSSVALLSLQCLVFAVGLQLIQIREYHHHLRFGEVLEGDDRVQLFPLQCQLEVFFEGRLLYSLGFVFAKSI